MAEFTISHPNVKKQQSYAQEGKQLIIEALTIDEEAKSTNDLGKRLKVIHRMHWQGQGVGLAITTLLGGLI